MDELQLRLATYKVRLIADAINRDLKVMPTHNGTKELTAILAWLEYRLARAEHKTAQATTE